MRGSRTALAMGFVLLTAFAVAAHFAIVSSVSKSAVGAGLSLIPLGFLVAWGVRRTHGPQTTVVAVVATIVALAIGWPALERHYLSVLFIEHAGANLVLAIVFGRTLLHGREALCTRFARMLHASLPPDVERYTRKVTAAWTIFFAAICLVSCVLYLTSHLTAWSLLANILSPILIAGMFLVEYLVRRRMLPAWEHSGLLSGVRTFARHFATQSEVPR